LLLLFNTAYASGVKTELDRTQVKQGETFQLSYSIDSENSDFSPDLSPLEKDFVVFGSGQSSQLSIINGKSTSSTKWTLTLSPKRSGLITIPSIHFGRFASKPKTIHVLKTGGTSNAARGAEAFLQASVSKENPYVQSQVIYTTKLYYAINLTNGSLTEPQSSDALIMQLGKDKTYQANKNGHPYQVIERRYAVFPQKSGELTIIPPIFTGLGRTQHVSRNRFSGLFTSMGKPIRLLANNIVLNVKPVPRVANMSTWLPASDLKLSETFSHTNQNYRVGDPITRTITIKANGLTAEQLPDLSIEKIDNVNTYSDHPVTKNSVVRGSITGERISKTAYIPEKTGAINIPAIKVSWWDTKSNDLRYANLPKRTLHIKAALNNPSPISTTTTAQTTIPAPIQMKNSDTYWRTLSALLLLLWLGTIILWKMKTRKSAMTTTSKTQETHNKTPSANKIKSEIKSACENKDAKRVTTKLIQWSQITWPNQNLKSIGSIAAFIDHPEMSKALLSLEHSQYAKESKEWNNDQFWQTFKNFQSTKKTITKKQTDPLPAMYQ